MSYLPHSASCYIVGWRRPSHSLSFSVTPKRDPASQLCTPRIEGPAIILQLVTQLALTRLAAVFPQVAPPGTFTELRTLSCNPCPVLSTPSGLHSVQPTLHIADRDLLGLYACRPRRPGPKRGKTAYHHYDNELHRAACNVETHLLFLDPPLS